MKSTLSVPYSLPQIVLNNLLCFFRRQCPGLAAGLQIPATIPAADNLAESMGRQFVGVPVTALTEILFNVPSTAHILGGAVMGANPQEGVIDSKGRSSITKTCTFVMAVWSGLIWESIRP